MHKVLLFRSEGNYNRALKSIRKAEKKFKKSNPQNLSLIYLLKGALHQEKMRLGNYATSDGSTHIQFFINHGLVLEAYQECMQSKVEPYATMAYIATLVCAYDYAVVRSAPLPKDKDDNSIALRIQTYKLIIEYIDKKLTDPIGDYSIKGEIDYHASMVYQYPSFSSIFLEIAFFKAQLQEKVALEFINAPIPQDLNSTEKEVYQKELYKYGCEFLAKAIQSYEALNSQHKAFNIEQTPWNVKAAERIQFCKEYKQCD